MVAAPEPEGVGGGSLPGDGLIHTVRVQQIQVAGTQEVGSLLQNSAHGIAPGEDGLRCRHRLCPALVRGLPLAAGGIVIVYIVLRIVQHIFRTVLCDAVARGEPAIHGLIAALRSGDGQAAAVQQVVMVQLIVLTALGAVPDVQHIPRHRLRCIGTEVILLRQAVVPQQLPEILIPEEVHGGAAVSLQPGVLPVVRIHVLLGKVQAGVAVGGVETRFHAVGGGQLSQPLLRRHALRQGLAVIQLHAQCAVAPQLVYGIRQIGAEGGGGDEQCHAEEQAHHRGAIALAVTLEVLGGQHPGETEELFRQAGGPDLPTPELHVLGLADGLHRRHPHGTLGGDPCRDDGRHKADARRRQQRPAVEHKVHLQGVAALPHQESEAVPQAVQSDADAQTAHQQTQWDPHGAQHQCLIEDTVPNLLAGGADGFQDTELPGPLRHGDGEGVIDQRHRAEGDHQQQDHRKAVDHPVHGEEGGGAVVIQQVGVGVPRQSRIFLGISLHIAVKAAGMGHPEKFIRLIALLLTGQGSIAGAGEGLRRHIQPLVKAHHSVGVGRGICQRLPLRIGVIGRQLLPTQRPVAQLQLHGVPQRMADAAIGPQMLRQKELPGLLRQATLGQSDG